MIYESGLMQIVSGRVVSTKQHTVTTEEIFFTNSGAMRQSEVGSEYVDIFVDTHNEPFSINTSNSRNFFIGKGDLLDIACIWRSTYTDIYGIRNLTDGSVYIARPEAVESRSFSYTATWGSALICCMAMASMVIEGVRDPVAYLVALIMSPFFILMVFCIYSLRRWGLLSNEIAGAHTQEGGEEEMKLAQEMLKVAPEELPMITPL
jgi:hypothetical protein